MSGGKRNPFQAMALMSAITSYLVGSILAGIFIGRWIDDMLHTSPLFLIVGLLLGLASGVLGMIRLINRFSGDK